MVPSVRGPVVPRVRKTKSSNKTSRSESSSSRSPLRRVSFVAPSPLVTESTSDSSTVRLVNRKRKLPCSKPNSPVALSVDQPAVRSSNLVRFGYVPPSERVMEDPTSLNTSSHLGLWSFPPVSDRFEDSASPVHSVVGSTTRIAGRSPRRSPRLKAKRKKSSLVRSLERQLAYAKAADRDQESSDSDSMSTNSAAPILEIPFVPSPEVAPVTVSSSSSQSSSAPSLASLQASVDLLLASRVLPSTHPSMRNIHLKTLPHSSTSTSSSSSSSFDFSASSMADTLTQHLADAGYGKGPKSKSLSAAGMNPRVVGLLSINPAATLSKGMAMSYDTIFSSVSASSPILFFLVFLPVARLKVCN